MHYIVNYYIYLIQLKYEIWEIHWFLHVVFGHGVARCFELGKISEISAKNGTLIIMRHDMHVYVYAYV
jgi:hypothetical protein